MTGVADSLRPVLAQESPEKARLRFGTEGADELGGWLEAFCADRLRDPARTVSFISGFAAGVIGLQLASGKHVVLKLHTADGLSFSHLNRAYELQEQLRNSGIPCAALVHPFTEIGPGLAAITHTHFAPGQDEDCATPHHRREIARALHRIVVALDGVRPGSIRAFNLDDVEVPRGPLRKLGLLQNQALAEMRRADEKKLVAHGDIKGRNVLFQDGGISAIYDFDSLMVTSEAVVVGGASVNFMSRRGQMRINLDPQIALGFVRDYEDFREKPFQRKQMEVVRAAAIVQLIRIGAQFLDPAVGLPLPRFLAALEAFSGASERLFR